MESIAFLVADILDRLRKIPGLEIHEITAAGGAARRPLLQFQADVLGLPLPSFFNHGCHCTGMRLPDRPRGRFLEGYLRGAKAHLHRRNVLSGYFFVST